MQERRPGTKPLFLQIALTVLTLLFFVAAYAVAMNAVVSVSRVTDDAGRDHRDQVYLALHGGFLLLAGIYGFTLGKWLNGLGVAFALLFVVGLSLSMVAVQISSYELACHGHNDLVRHWTC
jgi:CDP-diglyceride synthetase